ncbi:hypothetical protein F5X68DRAFT_44176 [Plectosphaerella plurivora]|uniref:Peptidase M14 domain-containing protein n=1 Tax=Plectosphaerella plurivora TaxID=936078 RepID=A0A9P9A4Q7_9PEZI|nr:hypothetical protein F5X68DRAFT_44176 [Plectosphaerella plurivora]
MSLPTRLKAGILAAACLVNAQRYGENSHVPVVDAPHVAAAFPDVDIEVLSPAFVNPETVPAGFAQLTSPATNQTTLENFLQTLADRNSWITYHNSPDLRSEEGRSLPYVRLSTNGTGNSTISGKVRVYLQGGVHGDEPGGDQALLALLGKFDANHTWALSVLEKVDLLVLPRYNPDAAAYQSRNHITGFASNGDHALLRSRHTRDVKKLLNDFGPHIALDAHEYTGVFPVAGYIRAQDVLVSPVKNPNIHPDIRNLGEGLFLDNVFKTIKSAGFRTGPYFTTSTSGGVIRITEPSSISNAGHNSWGLGQTLSFLTETRGIRLGPLHFHRRVAAGLTAIEAILQTAVDNSELVYSTIEGARRKFVDSDSDVIVVDEARVTDTTIAFINANGSIVDVPVQFNNNTPSEVILTRPRPEAYIFSPAFSDVAERLRVLGVEVEVLPDEWTGTVETLTVASVSLESSRSDGIVRSTVTTTTGSREVTFPPGAFRVSTRQRNAAYAFVTLEPENRSSYVTYNLFSLDQGQEYPVFRLPRK